MHVFSCFFWGQLPPVVNKCFSFDSSSQGSYISERETLITPGPYIASMRWTEALASVEISVFFFPPKYLVDLVASRHNNNNNEKGKWIYWNAFYVSNSTKMLYYNFRARMI